MSISNVQKEAPIKYYGNKEFCSIYQSCKWGDICSNALTEKVNSEAHAYGVPIYKMNNGCPEYIKKKV